MTRHGRLAEIFAATSLLLLNSSVVAKEVSPATRSFDAAVRSDAEGNASLAFSLYRRAAEAGLPSAEFNVAIMLDSGRGVRSDLAEAATWYARAASHGEARAAYNLGQLYETGEGVPENLKLARTWFALSGLVAARERLATLRRKSRAEAGMTWTAPRLVAPPDITQADARVGGFELVWTSGPQPQPVKFFVELRILDAKGSHEVFSRFIEQSSIFAQVPVSEGDYAWRVTSVAQHAGEYVASGWARFSVGSVPRTSANETDRAASIKSTKTNERK